MQGRLKLAREDDRAARGPDLLSALRLARSRNVGPATWGRLMARFGDPARALEALPELARRGGMAGFAAFPEDEALRELEAGDRLGARLLVRGSADYPAMLAEIVDPPPVLWLRGDAAWLVRPAVAIVGGRNASALGLRMAETMAAELGEAGLVVVSGLARGVDGAAHRGALRHGTVAALAGGVDVVYPPEHAGLMDEIAAQGALVAEQPIGQQPQARHFPRRNRIIAGLARAVVVVEAAARSGSLITAEFAVEQGREVMAAPGAPLDPRASGCNALIREGATLVRDARDVVEALGAGARAWRPAEAWGAGAGRDDDLIDGLAEGSAPRPLAPPPEAATRAQVAELLGLAPVEEDVLARLSGASLASLADALLELELAGRLDRRPGGMLALLPD